MPTVTCFDLDDTLIHDSLTVCNDTIEILEYLKEQGVKITLASHNEDGGKILEQLGIRHFFDLVLAYHDWSDKKTHLRRVIKEFNVKPEDIVFIDDLDENLQTAEILGIPYIAVDPETGVALLDVLLKFHSLK